METTPHVFKITAYGLPEMQAKLAKLNRRAAKLGCPQLTLEVVETKREKVRRRDEEGAMVWGTFHTVHVTGEAPRINGWSLVGRIDRSLSAPLMMTVPGKEMPTKYREAVSPVCDHCQTKRWRKDTFVVQNEAGETKEIGRNCLKDFLGMNVEAFLSFCKSFESISEEASEWSGWNTSRAETEIDIFSVLEMTAMIMREYGWVSRREADDSTGKTATSTWVNKQLFPSKDMPAKERIKPDQKAGEVAQATLDYVRNSMSGNSDYEHNLRTICKDEFMPVTKIGLVCSAVFSYQRAMGLEIKRAAERAARGESNYIGTVGQRFDFDAQFVRAHHIEGRFGATSICEFLTMTDAKGPAANVVKWFASNDPALDQGRWYRLRGTVKAHKEYRGAKETVMTRVAVLDGPISPSEAGDLRRTA